MGSFGTGGSDTRWSRATASRYSRTEVPPAKGTAVAARSLSALGALGVVVALSLSGCALTSQVTTGKPYAASDGVGGTVDGVVAQNLLLITSGAGAKAALVGSLYNETGAAVTVEVTVEKGKASLRIPSMSTVTLGLADGDSDLITTSTVAPGRTSQVTISVNKGAPTSKPLPVLDGTLPEYAGIVAALEAKRS